LLQLSVILVSQFLEESILHLLLVNGFECYFLIKLIQESKRWFLCLLQYFPVRVIFLGWVPTWFLSLILHIVFLLLSCPLFISGDFLNQHQTQLVSYLFALTFAIGLLVFILLRFPFCQAVLQFLSNPLSSLFNFMTQKLVRLFWFRFSFFSLLL
jgi:hypothetical protein